MHIEGKNEANCCDRTEGDCDIVWQIDSCKLGGNLNILNRKFLKIISY